jgi:hypothetical protein
MTIVVGEMREQTTAKPEADPCGMTNKRTSNNSGNSKATTVEVQASSQG